MSPLFYRMYDFSEDEIRRYSRNILLAEVGAEGQEKLRRARVLIVGVGGLGSPVALYLAAAGVGTIGLVDFDVVDTSNLQRQVLHSSPDVGCPKVDSAAKKLGALNPGVRVVAHRERFCAANAEALVGEYDFVVDAVDNYAAKFLINDACVLAGRPFSHGGVLRFEGDAMTYVPGHACYRCVFNAPPPPGVVPTCAEAGVLGSVAGVLGTIQATETLKYFLGVGDLLTDKLLSLDAKTMDFRKVNVRRNDQCPICGRKPTISKLADYDESCGSHVAGN